jgi:hypothetical protein
MRYRERPLRWNSTRVGRVESKPRPLKEGGYTVAAGGHWMETETAAEVEGA